MERGDGDDQGFERKLSRVSVPFEESESGRENAPRVQESLHLWDPRQMRLY